jgi:hypothetical protein
MNGYIDRQAREDKTLTRLGGEYHIGRARASLFGVLADLAWPHVEHYRSDLYHDAQWLEHYVQEPCEFYFGCDAWGTAIGMDKDLVRISRKNVWRIELLCEASLHTVTTGTWYVRTTELPAVKVVAS